jgi:chromosomal replication initiation ATPase DnaA
VSDFNPWQQVLAHIRRALSDEDYRRWFSDTGYASDSGDQITVWVPTEAARRHIAVHFQDHLDRALAAIGRDGAHIRFVVTGLGGEEEEWA